MVAGYRIPVLKGLAWLLALCWIQSFRLSASQVLPGLPLEVLVTTPSAIRDESNPIISLSGKDTITAVFSRPVIALGSDFGQSSLPASLVPFSLECNGASGSVPGAIRWVTTNVARFDPLVDWPPDLSCAFKWNKALTSYDGVKLTLPPNAFGKITLETGSLTMSVKAVTSSLGDTLTDNQWNAYKGMYNDNFPEFLPGSNLTLTFSDPVDFNLLRKSLKTAACCNSTAGASQLVLVLPCNPPYYIPSPFARQSPTNGTCALVQLSPGLPPPSKDTNPPWVQVGLKLLLPKGAFYNTFSGPLREDKEVYLWGPRRFRIPLRWDFEQLQNATDDINYPDNALTYRRWTMWLPLGLAKGGTAGMIGKQTSLCKYKDPYKWETPCEPVDFKLDLVNRGQLLMTVPTALPREHYHLTVKGTDKIRDGLGTPLEGTEAFFFTSDPSNDMQGPNSAAGGALLSLEKGSVGSTLPWPVVTRGKPVYASDPVKIAVWNVSVSDVPDVLERMRGKATRLGTPASEVIRTNSSVAKFTQLKLSKAPVQLVAKIDANGDVYGPQFVTQSDLQYSAITLDRMLAVWITTATGNAAGVKDATVSVLLSRFSDNTVIGPSCLTGADGTCSVDMTSFLAKDLYGEYWVTVKTSKDFLLVPGGFNFPYFDADSYVAKYKGKLVLDRLLVQPGETLHIAGYVQGKEKTKLFLPEGLTSVTMQISPNFNTSDETPVRWIAKVDPVFGTFNTTLKVPDTAVLQDYEVQARMPGAPDDSTMLDTEEITVGDPRPPTALLNITVPSWAPPASTVEVKVEAISYIGADVGDASMTLTWTVPLASGTIPVTTNAKGVAYARIPLGDLPAQNATKIGDTLSIEVKWIGPTRERIKETKPVRLEQGPVRSVLDRSPVSEVPGVPFTVSAETYLNDEFSTQIEGVKVEVSLHPFNGSVGIANCSAEQVASMLKQTCTVTSGKAPGQSPCMITLPCAGNFLLRACATTFANGTAIKGAGGKAPCSESLLGRNTTAWQENPWSLFPDLHLLKSQANQTQGSAAELYYVNPYWGPAQGLIVWGNEGGMKMKSLGAVKPGLQRVNIPIGEECLGNCKVALLLSVARQPKTAGLLPGAAPVPGPDRVPKSKLFDPLAPHVQSSIISLNVLQDNRLLVKVDATGASKTEDNVAVLRPLKNGSVTIKVQDAVTKAPAVGAMVTVFMTDQAILDLLPYPLQDVANDMTPADGETYIEYRGMEETRLNLAAINLTFAMLNARLDADPWLPIVTTCSNSLIQDQGSWFAAPYYPTTNPVDVPIAQYLRMFSSSVTVTPFYGWGLTQRYPGGSTGPAADPSAALRLAKDFVTTPVFKSVVTNADGIATLPIKAPANLGAFSIRAYAVSEGAPKASSKYGSNETQVIVRNPLSLTESVPRIVRIGDIFDAGAIVTIPGLTASEKVEVTATVVPPNGTNQQPPLELASASAATAKNTITLTPNKTNLEVRFRFQAVALGDAVVQIRAKALGSGEGDAVQLKIPVLGRQGPVYIGTSFAVPVSNGSAATAQEGLDLPGAEPGSGSIVTSAGVGYLPAVQGLYTQLVQQQDKLEDITDQTAGSGLSTASIAPVLTLYSKQGLLTPAQVNTSKAAANYVATVLTHPSLGFMWFKPDPDSSDFVDNSHPDVPLNAWGVWILNSTAVAASKSNNTEIKKYYSTLHKTAKASWLSKVGPELERLAIQVSTPVPPLPQSVLGPSKPAPRVYEDYDTMSWARLVLGASWSPSSDALSSEDSEVATKVKTALSLGTLVTAATTPGKTGVGTQARTGLVLLADLKAKQSASTKASLDKIASQITGTLRVSGQVAYVASGPGSASAASQEEQAFALLFLTQYKPKTPLLQKLASYVAGGQVAGAAPLSIAPGGTAAGTIALALSSYDDARGSTKPDLKLAGQAFYVSAGNSSIGGTSKPYALLSATFTAASAGRVQSSNNTYTAIQQKLGKPPNRATFTAVGNGEVSVAVGLDFVPAALLPFPSYRGLWVDSIIQPEDGDGRLTATPLASIVTVAIQITSPDDLGPVVVEARMPGGLEPLDPNVYQDIGSSTLCEFSSYWFWCPQQETSPAMVKFTFGYLSAGTVSLRFKAVAATPGKFVLPPVKAFAVQQPEVLGLSAAGRFLVCPTAATAGQEPVEGCTGSGVGAGKPLSPPKGCPKDCSSNGVCNFSDGACICNAGFSGAACDKFAVSR